MMSTRNAASAAASLLLAACATVPPQQVTASGTLPSGTYAVIRPDKEAAPLPALAGLQGCLAGAGLQEGAPAATLLQASYVLRPARAAVLLGGAEPPKGRRGPARSRDREALALTMTDRATGEVRWRGSVERVLGKNETAGDGTALVAPLCAALKPAPAAAPR